MEQAKVIQKLIYFISETSLVIFLKYACYFINIVLYFISLHIIKQNRDKSATKGVQLAFIGISIIFL